MSIFTSAGYVKKFKIIELRSQAGRSSKRDAKETSEPGQPSGS
ncbi:hypothetical protein ARSEF1564_004243 [Beauveria bassiana]